MHYVVRTSKKYALNRPTLPSLWLVQARIDLTQIEVVALEEDGFLLSKKLICPLINQVGDDISASMNEPSVCALQNLFGNGIFAHVYKPLDLDAWPKSRNGKKIHCPGIVKLSILPKTKWEVGRTLEVTLLAPSNIPPPR
jgi:hypothetical protein